MLRKNGLIEAKGDAVITVKYGYSGPAAGEVNDMEYTATASISSMSKGSQKSAGLVGKSLS